MKKIDYLHGLRGLAALTVVIGHCMQAATMNAHHAHGVVSVSIFPWWLRLWDQVGALAVPTFIILSGYVLALPVVRDGRLKSGIIDFYTRRANRILPAYVFAVAFGLIVAAEITHEATWYTVFDRQFWSTLFLMHDWIDQRPDWNRPLWSMAIEWHIYVFAPLMYWAWKRFGIVRSSLAGIAFCLILAIIVPHFGFVWARLEFYACFIVGAVAAQVCTNDRPTAQSLRAFPHWRATAIGLVVIFEICVLQTGWDASITAPFPFIVAWSIVMFACLVALNQPNTTTRTCLERRPVIALGTISYSLYLLHWPIVDAVSTMLPKVSLGAETVATIIVAVPISLIVATCSYWFLERPYLSRRIETAKSPISPAGTVKLVTDSSN